MAKIVITTTENYVIADMGDYIALPEVNIKKGAWNKRELDIRLYPGDEYVNVYIVGANEWQLDQNEIKGLKVDTIDGVAVTDNADLFDKLTNV